MKHITRLYIFSSILCIFQMNGREKEGVPVYITEYISNLGLTDVIIDSRRSAHADIKEAILKMGFARTQAAAIAAIDRNTGDKYFHIRDEKDAFIIERKYDYGGSYISLKIYLVKDGLEYSDVIFTQSYIR